jgi:hypothetical protein
MLPQEFRVYFRDFGISGKTHLRILFQGIQGISQKSICFYILYNWF